MAGRPQKYNLESVKDLIQSLIQESHLTVDQIRETLAAEWGVDLQEVPSASTLNRKLKAWNARISDQPSSVQKAALRTRCSPSVYDDSNLIDEIIKLRSQGLQSPEMLQYLQSTQWPSLSMKQLTKLREKHN